MRYLPAIILLGFCGIFASCSSVDGTVVRAEEYFSIATAYFELGKYAEAERWFNLARRSEKTKFAADYNLGRIAFQKGDSEDAAKRFEELLTHDPSNTTVLRAAAYSWMKAGKWDKALALFERIADLLPETEDARYNFALALSSADRLEEAAEKLKPYVERRPDDREALLLLARTEKKMGKPEAADRFLSALALKEDASVRLELAEIYESLQLYARALETYQILLASNPGEKDAFGKAELRFRKARVMMLAGEDPAKCLEELKGALGDGFKDSERIGELLEDGRVAETYRAPLKQLIADLSADRKESAPDALAPKGSNEP